MPNYGILTKEDLENKIFNSQICCEQEVVIVNGVTSTKPIILTMGVATCSVCIIYDPLTKLTLFAHIDELINIQKSQSKLLIYLKSKDVDISRIKIFVGGGRFSQPSSRMWALQLKQFWQEIVKENLNDELFLKRDCFALDSNEAWNYIKQHTTGEEFQALDIYLKNLAASNSNLDKSYFYLRGERAEPIAKKTADILVKLCKEKKLIENTSYPLIGVQMVTSEDQGSKALVDLTIPDKSVFPIIGFDTHKGEMFIVNDFCADIINKLINDLGIEKRWNANLNRDDQELDQLKEVQDKFDGVNKYQTLSPLSERNLLFLNQRKIKIHEYYNDVFYMDSKQLTSDVREKLKLDRKKLTKVTFEQLRFLRQNIPGITIEIDNSNPKSLNALVTFGSSEKNLQLVTDVVYKWKEMKTPAVNSSDNKKLDGDADYQKSEAYKR